MSDPNASKVAFLKDLIIALRGGDRGERSPDLADARAAFSKPAIDRLSAACEVLLGRIGDFSCIAVAEQALQAYGELDEAGQKDFFVLLRDRFNADPEAIRASFAAYDADPSSKTLAPLSASTEPRRQTLLRRLNMAPGATLQLIHMRADLLEAIRIDPDLAAIDADFLHLLSSWFNRGFLQMRRIDWTSSAEVLEKIMGYESVHPMADWADLRRRLNPADRRLYAFFHPATACEPLTFVEVALTRDMPSEIAPILSTQPESADAEGAATAVFYSINNTLPGLKGVTLGNFLIKQVVSDLSSEIPELDTFVTLSPMPGFAAWLENCTDERGMALAARLATRSWHNDTAEAELIRPELETMAARYIFAAKTRSGTPIDPVARFHIGNGATAWRINWQGDPSDDALARSHGLMINYLYDPATIEANHEAFVRDGAIAIGPQLADLLSDPSHSTRTLCRRLSKAS